MINYNNAQVAVIGGGLAGCECAMALAKAGLKVVLFEMRPQMPTPAHTSGALAELVCSNSFRSADLTSAIGLLKQEIAALNSLVIHVAQATAVPAGKALAVDRALFSAQMTRAIEQEHNITLVRREISSLNPDFCHELSTFSKIAVCAGPLASPGLSASLAELAGTGQLYFYDAIAPIISGDSIDMSIAFRGSRYGKDSPLPEETTAAAEGEKTEGDYINCPLSKEEYFNFREALLDAQKTPTQNFEREVHFEGCMPIEALAERGPMTLAFGPFKPVGFVDPRTQRRPFALLQLRAENINQSMFNLVGCQTKLTYPEQERIFRMIPGLEKAEFVRHGSMHRNTFVNSPLVLDDKLALRTAPHIHLAGQITGVEGYVESAACGLWLGLLLAAELRGLDLPAPPLLSALGALLEHLRRAAKNFQPSNVQYGLMPELEVKAKKSNRKLMYAQRTQEAFAEWREQTQGTLQALTEAAAK